MFVPPDGNKEDEEEMSGLVSRGGAELDFDALLKQATQKLKKTNKKPSARH